MSGAFKDASSVIRAVVAAAALAALAACGGGGGGSGGDAPMEGGQGTGGSGTGTGTGTGGSEGAGFVTIAPIVDSPEAFHVKVDSGYSTVQALEGAAGGALFAAWDPTNASGVLDPGLKVMFFGHAPGCDNGAFDAGPTTHGADADYAEAATRAHLAAADESTLRWVPSADTAACAADLAGHDGPSMVQVDARDAGGGIGLYTDGGTMDDASAAFLAPWDAQGQDGHGANAGILGTFVTFRQDWTAADPKQPWKSGADARIATIQTLGATAVGDASDPAQFVQVKQQVSVTFLNVACARTLLGAGSPCQIQYLLDTAILRTGVPDWSQVDWFNAGGVMFDPGQGGIPVISGPIRNAAAATTDADSGLELFVSEGNATQHAAFAGVGFDVHVPFADLLNAARVVAGRKQSVAAADVTGAEMAAYWGASWNDPEEWILLASEVGQEVYDPYTDKKAWIGGSFSELFVGPAP
jgi:hypothetical protein